MRDGTRSGGAVPGSANLSGAARTGGVNQDGAACSENGIHGGAYRPGEVRVLAVFCGAFSAGIFLAQYLLPVNWLLPGAWSAFAAACLGFLIPGTLPPAYPEKRALLPGNAGKYLLLTGTGLAFALGWNWLYVQRTAAPAAALSGVEQTVEMSIQDYPASIPYGIRATVKMDGIPGLAAWYGGWEYAGLQPGQVIQDTVRFQDAGHIREDDVTAFTSRGIFLLSYGQKNTRLLGEGTAASLRWLPLRTGKAVQEKIHELLQGDQAAFLSALLTADRSDLSVQAASDLEEAGLTHVLAVSGMHCGFLLAVLAFVVGRHRRHLLALIAVLVLIFFAFLTGGRPSVVRACIMLFFLLAAPLFNRESDAPTALMAALFLILLHNPFAAESVSLQLSFASVFGLLWLTPKLYRGLLNWLTAIPPFRWEKPSSPLPASASPGHAASHGLYRFRGALFRFLAASVSASLGALAFTAPLSGYYFGVLPVAAPLSGVLCLWAVGAAFVTGLAAVGIGFVCPPLGPIAALVPGLFIRYILFMAHAMVRLPGHALYFANPLLKYWLAFAYLLPAAAYFVKMPLRRKVVWTAMLLALSLAGTVLLYRGQYQHDLDAVELDVGQGQCILLASGGRYALADCGSGSSWYDAGALAARKLRSLGCRQLDMLLLTHFDADHINGAEALLARLPVRELLIPTVPESESAGARDTVVSLAKRYGADVRTVTEREVLPFGLGMLTVFPPVDSSGDNDSGLSLLASAGEADFLITGDMGQAAERKLLSAYDLPDLEAFAAGHHGSKYSTSETLLDTLTPETVCVSVGSNSYGHPAPETLDRLEARGITVYRTDRDGDIHLALDR